MQLISNWKDMWRMTSVWVTAAGGAILGLVQEFPNEAITVWSYLPADIKSVLPPGVVKWIGYVILAVGILSRGVKQRSLARRKAEADRAAELGAEADAGRAAGDGIPSGPPGGPGF